MTNANRHIVRKRTLAEEGQDDDYRNLSIEERWSMMWPLTIDAWAMRGIDVTNQPMRRDVEHVIRNGPNHD